MSSALRAGNASLHDRRWWILVVLCLSVLLVTIDNTIVNVALPTIGRQLSASTSDLQWVVDAYTLVFAGLLLVAGNLGDRLGRRRTLQVGLALFAVTSLGAAAAQNTGQLIAGRAAMGVGAALVYPATLALLANAFTSPRERATAIGVWSAVSGLAVALGPVSGGLLLEHFAWGSVFLVNVPLVAVALLAGWWLLPESRDAHPGRFDILGALGSVAGVGLLVWTVIEAPANGWTSTTTLVTLSLSLAMIAAFVAWEARRRDPLLDVRLFTNPRFATASGAIALAFFGLFGFIFLITQYFQVVRGYDTLTAGVATLPFAIVTGALSPVAIVLMKRVGTKYVVAAGLALMTAGFLLASTSTAHSAYWGLIIVAMSLMAAGLALTSGPATDAIMGAVPTSKAGAGSAVNDTTREIGGTLGVAVVGSVMSSMYGPRVVDALSGLGLPPSAVTTARESVIAGLTVTGNLPETLQAPARAAVSNAFMGGLQAGSLVAAGVTALAAIAALAFLPSRHRVAEAAAVPSEQLPPPENLVSTSWAA
jgi:EmrB/QacA subfamily drug resistance transporter